MTKIMRNFGFVTNLVVLYLSFVGGFKVFDNFTLHWAELSARPWISRHCSLQRTLFNNSLFFNEFLFNFFLFWWSCFNLSFWVLKVLMFKWYRASEYPREYDGACLQMRLSYSQAAHTLLFLVQWTDCRLAGALGLLRILIYKVIIMNLFYTNCNVIVVFFYLMLN